jgi:hypothetical protein
MKPIGEIIARRLLSEDSSEDVMPEGMTIMVHQQILNINKC